MYNNAHDPEEIYIFARHLFNGAMHGTVSIILLLNKTHTFDLRRESVTICGRFLPFEQIWLQNFESGRISWRSRKRKNMTNFKEILIVLFLELKKEKLGRPLRLADVKTTRLSNCTCTVQESSRQILAVFFANALQIPQFWNSDTAKYCSFICYVVIWIYWLEQHWINRSERGHQ